MTMEDIERRARAIAGHLIEIRRDLHAHPELSAHEERTAGAIERELREIGLAPRRCYRTGVVAVIEGARPGRCVALRADIDALPLTDEKTGPVRSEVPGRMHACGHDAHTACLLGAARILHEMRDELSGSVKLIFQPDEEDNGGALPMIKEGVLEDPHVDAAFALHADPKFDVGTIGLRKGPIFAAADHFDVVVCGVGAHGAYPEKSIDPIFIASLCVTALQSVVSRNVPSTESAVVTVGSLHAGRVRNIIPSRAELSGTIRTLSTKMRELVPRRVRETIEGICESMGATCEYTSKEGYPLLSNDGEMTDLVRAAASEMLGADKVNDDIPWLGAEDFAYFANEVPSCMFRLGTRNEARGIVHPLHSPHFDIDEGAIPIGASLMAACAKRFLGK